MSEEGYDSFLAWVASRPEAIKRLIAEFPPATTRVEIDGTPYVICGYVEEGEQLVLMPQGCPYRDRDARKIYLCAAHLRDPNEFTTERLQ